MELKVTVDTSGWDAVKEAIARQCTEAEHDVALRMEEDTRPFVPALTMSMTQRTRVVGNSIVYPGPYAQFLYYGKVMVDPNTGSTYAPKDGTKVVTSRDIVFTKTVHPQAQAFWCEASKAQNLDKWVKVAEKAVNNGGSG